MLEDKIESILNEKELFEETIIDTIFKFGNNRRLNEYRERFNQIFRNINCKSSSTESSDIKFETSDDEDDNNGDQNAECADDNGESMIVDNNEGDPNVEKSESNFEKDEGIGNDKDDGSNNIRDEAAGNKEQNRRKKDVASENNEASSINKDEAPGNNEGKKDETNKVTSQKNENGEKIQDEHFFWDDASIFDELLNKSDEQIKNEFREMKEKEAKLASKKLEDLTDEEFFEAFKDSECQTFGNEKNVKEKQTEEAGESSQKLKEKEQEGPSSCQSREHIFVFTPGGSQPSFNLGFDTPEEQLKPFKKTESNDEETQYRCLQSPYINEKVSTTEEPTDDELLLARSIFSMQGNEA